MTWGRSSQVVAEQRGNGRRNTSAVSISIANSNHVTYGMRRISLIAPRGTKIIDDSLLEYKSVRATLFMGTNRGSEQDQALHAFNLNSSEQSFHKVRLGGWIGLGRATPGSTVLDRTFWFYRGKQQLYLHVWQPVRLANGDAVSRKLILSILSSVEQFSPNGSA